MVSLGLAPSAPAAAANRLLQGASAAVLPFEAMQGESRLARLLIFSSGIIVCTPLVDAASDGTRAPVEGFTNLALFRNALRKPVWLPALVPTLEPPDMNRARDQVAATVVSSFRVTLVLLVISPQFPMVVSRANAALSATG